MLGRLTVLFTVLAMLCPAAARAQLTLDTVFGVDPPWGAQPSRIVWAPDSTSFLYVLQSQDPFQPVAIRRYDLTAKSDGVLIDPSAYGKPAETPGSLTWSPDSKMLAFTIHGTLYVRDMATGADRRIDARVADPQWSPRGDALAYVKSADLYVARVRGASGVRRLTRGGAEDRILNGSLDWVYPEELGTAHGFAWSPDGASIAYMQMDERPVTAFPLTDFLDADNTAEYQRYPLAGERNPRVALRLIALGSGNDRLVYDAGAHDEYLPFFGWIPQTKQLEFEMLNRQQTTVRVLALSRNGRQDILYAQSDPKWVDDVPLPTWLRDGRSLWLLDRDGTNGVYVRDAAGAKITRLTGPYRSDRILGVNGAGDTAYITAAYPTRRDRALIAVSLKDGATANLTPAAGAHGVSLAPNAGAFVDTHSTLNDPPQTDLVATADRAIVATLAERNSAFARELSQAEMLTIASPYGPLDATMVKPPAFDPAHRYPVIVYVYGGPASPTTTNAFGDQRALYHRLLAQNGIIVFSIDGPASQIDSDANVRLLYHNFGPASLMGQEVGASYLRSLPYVDPARIGIWGWSFGGYETLYALTHSTSFKAGAAVAPVTDWHFYDTIYTERYMGEPQNDKAAYDASSVLPAAGNLHGPVLISHGTSDDNVHMANTISLLQRFIDTDRTAVDFMVYPRRTHSIAGIAQRRHLYGHMLEWWLQHL